MKMAFHCVTILFVVGASGCGSATSTPAPAKSPTVLTVTSLNPDGAVAAEPVALQATKAPADSKKVALLRAPNGGIQPQAVMDNGVLHLIYYKGDPKHGDVFYVKSKDDGKTFTKSLRVNSHPGSVVAMGNVRGAHLAIGAGGRAHVAWMGSMKAEPKVLGKEAPMLYARLNDAGDAFEPQRNLIQAAVGLDGGGSIAADGKDVYVAWHAPTPGTKGEENRRVWLTASADEGKSFGKETPISPADAGSCGCCGMRVFSAAPGQAFALFRGARDTVQRPMFLLSGDAASGVFRSVKLAEWETGTCPMSTMAFAAAGAETLAAWETEGQTFFARVKDGTPSTPVASPGKSNRQRHPTVATNGRDVLLAWTEGMAWNKGGSLAWQVYDAADQPAKNAKTADYGRADGVPVWSLITAVTATDGRFVIIY